MVWEGCGGALGQRLGGGLECYLYPIELTSAPSDGCLLELQKQEDIAVNGRSTISCSLQVYPLVGKIRSIY